MTQEKISMDLTEALNQIDNELFKNGKDWNKHTPELREAVTLIRDLVQEKPDSPPKSIYMVEAEVREVTRYLTRLNHMALEVLTVRDHVLYDSNGEPIGKVVFNPDADAFVFEYNYLEDTNG